MKNNLIYITILFIGISYGFYLHRNKPWPYEYVNALKDFVKQIEENEISRVTIDENIILTHTTPIKLDRKYISSSTPISICNIKETYVVVDSDFNLTLFEDDKPENYTFDELKSDQFSQIRVNDLLCNEQGEIYLSWSYFDESNSKVAIQINKIFLPIDQTLKHTDEIFNIYTNYDEPIASGKMEFYGENILITTPSNYVDSGYIVAEEDIGFAQDENQIYGKILKINNDKTFEIFTIGHRNPQGLFKVNDKIFETEHGPRGGDEINVITEGSNYGWPYTSSGVPYESYKSLFGALGRHSNLYSKPIYEWNPSIGISNGVFLENFEIDEWNNDLIIGSLKNQRLYRVRLHDNQNYVQYLEEIFIGERIRDIANTKNNIGITTDNGNYILIDFVEGYENEIIWFDSRAPLLVACLNCHQVSGTSNGIAPNLTKLFNRNVGSDADFLYSDALTESGAIWTEELFIDYIMNPSKVFPGTTMSYQVQSKAIAMDIYNLLKLENNAP
jgi:cytochrome c2